VSARAKESDEEEEPKHVLRISSEKAEERAIDRGENQAVEGLRVEKWNATVTGDGEGGDV